MSVSAVIFKKEWRGLFATPVVYLVMAVFFGLMGYLFFGLVTQFQVMSLQFQGQFGMDPLSLNEAIVLPMYGNVCVLWLLLLPLVTMRLLSEERKSQTFVFLLTSPIKLSQIVLGKFLAGFAFVALLLAITSIYPIICIVFGNAEWGPVLTANLGLLLMGGIFVALGLLASALTESQLLSAVLGFGFILFFWIVDFLSEIAPSLSFLKEFSLLSHLEPFLKGLLDTYHLGFYALFLGSILFATHQVLGNERWR